MSENAAQANALPFKVVIPIVTATFLICGCCYLRGYWSHFGIDFVQYISVSEVIWRSFVGVSSIIGMILIMGLIQLSPYWFGPVVAWFEKWEMKAAAKRIAAGKKVRPEHEVTGILMLLSFLIEILVLADAAYTKQWESAFFFMIAPLTASITELLSLFVLKLRPAIGWVTGLLLGILPALSFFEVVLMLGS